MCRHRTLALVLTCAALTLGAPHAQAMPRLVSGGTTKSAGFAAVTASGAEWQLPGAVSIKAQPGSELRILGRPQDVAIGPGKPRPVYTVILRRGRLDIQIPPRVDTAVAVAAPDRVTLLVRRGQAGIRADAGRVALANQRADVAAAIGDLRFKPIAPGTVRVVEGGTVTDRHLLAPPTRLAGQRLFMSAGQPVKLGGLSWERLGGVTSYRVELMRSSEAKPLLSIETSDAELLRPDVSLEPGTYRVLIRSIDAFGFASPHALESRLRVVAARLPAGAYFDGSGRIRMVPGSRVALSHAEDLELTDGSSSIPLEAALERVDGSEPVTLLVRGPGEDDHHLPLRFGPRTVRARIELTPARATWPKDPVTITLSLEDPSGPVPEWLQMQPEVRLGIDRLELDFEREGHTLRATLPPQAGPGPWVVRVEVKDQFGLPLGRNFLEISPTQGDRPKPRHSRAQRRSMR